MKTCPQCSNLGEPDDLFCDECGARLGEVEAAASALPQNSSPVASLRPEQTVTDIDLTYPQGLVSASIAPQASYASGEDISVCWNRGRAKFTAGTNGVLQFKVLPMSGIAGLSDLRVKVQLPTGKVLAWKKAPLQLSRERSVTFNIPKEELHAGSLALECTLAYQSPEGEKYRMAELIIDVEDPSHRVTQAINIAGINMDGHKHAGEGNQAININLGGNSEANGAVEWEPLMIHVIEKEEYYGASEAQGVKLGDRLTLVLSNGFKLHVYNKTSLTLGRDKHTDICTRNLPWQDAFPTSELKYRNSYISGTHASIEADRRGFVIYDGTPHGKQSYNGLQVNEARVIECQEVQSDFSMIFSLKGSHETKFFMKAKILPAKNHNALSSLNEPSLFLQRNDAIPEAYLWLRGAVCLADLFSSCPSSDFLCLKNDELQLLHFSERTPIKMGEQDGSSALKEILEFKQCGIPR